MLVSVSPATGPCCCCCCCCSDNNPKMRSDRPRAGPKKDARTDARTHARADAHKKGRTMPSPRSAAQVHQPTPISIKNNCRRRYQTHTHTHKKPVNSVYELLQTVRFHLAPSRWRDADLHLFFFQAFSDWKRDETRTTKTKNVRATLRAGDRKPISSYRPTSSKRRTPLKRC